MSETIPAGTRKNRLTLYIIIALLAGIALGFVLNQTYLSEFNARLPELDAQLLAVKSKIAATTDSLQLSPLLKEKSKISTENSFKNNLQSS